MACTYLRLYGISIIQEYGKSQSVGNSNTLLSYTITLLHGYAKVYKHKTSIIYFFYMAFAYSTAHIHQLSGGLYAP